MLDQLLQKIFSREPYPFYMKGRTDVIFLHVPKTGGTSVSRALNCYKVKESKVKKHNTPAEIITAIGNRKYKKAFKFCFVRNPWDRLHSWFRYIRDIREPHMYTEFRNFNDWLLSPEFESWRENDFHLYRNQIDWITDSEGKVDLDFIGHYENLQEDFNTVCKLIKVEPVMLPVKISSGERVDYRNIYSEEARLKVELLYKRDIEYFGYKY